MIQIKIEIIANFDASITNIFHLKRIKFEILMHASITNNSVITCDKIIDAKITKTVTTNFDEIK